MSQFGGSVFATYVRGAEPVVRLLQTRQARAANEFGIEKWTTDQLTEFLHERVAPGTGTSSATEPVQIPDMDDDDDDSDADMDEEEDDGEPFTILLDHLEL